MISIQDAIVLSVVVAALYWIKSKSRRGLPLPPSHRGLPIIGNLRDVPYDSQWETYHDMSKKLDTDILYLDMFGSNVIVLDTYEAAIDLLEKRSSIYSGRPRMPMVIDLMGWDFSFAFIPYNDRWRKQRRLMHQHFSADAARTFRPHLLKGAHRFLVRVLDEQDTIDKKFRHMAADKLMSFTYGIDVQSKDDPYIEVAEKGNHGLIKAILPGAFLVDALPFLKHVPEWFPGAGFKRQAREWREFAHGMRDMPFDAAKRNIASGAVPATSFFVYNCLQTIENGTKDPSYTEDLTRCTAGSIYSAAADTTVAALSSFILGILKHPEVIKKARQELDSVVKPGHLPDFDDELSLPYITAIVKEALRWSVVVPVSVPHSLDQEDEYKGYHIPVNSVVLPNVWAMLMNEDAYPNPSEFNPDRFIKDGKFNPDVFDPENVCWGFGRRICPGRYIAYSSVWITIASMLSVFDIEKAKDDTGNPVEPAYDYECGLVRPIRTSRKQHEGARRYALIATFDIRKAIDTDGNRAPLLFKCSIIPSSKETVLLIRASANEDIF
ncbi:hypothetical protein NLJ89_g1328 [Agrocybe chaxingu]|uniref:Cytochrome P450 n=1 Tax=Agrocybe chaxingu TaxID=84603 RepID=A0A9W8TFE9_9AGAR|nr:hypothetical protein NLJ89_g1328 [Agrocybe chaxingu]